MLSPRNRYSSYNYQEHLSRRYRHKSEDLWEQYQEGQIDHKRYLELLEAIKAEEIESEAKRNPFFGVSPERRSTIENNIWEYERLRGQAREQEAQGKAEAERKKSLSPLEKYQEDVPEIIARYQEEANRYRRIANRLQIIIIVGSVLVTSATSAAGFGLYGEIFRWVAPIISIVVAGSAGLIGYFKFKERSFNLQQTADAIEQEFKSMELGIRSYKGKQLNDAQELFTERVEFLIEEQKKRQQQLEQPPDLKHGQSHL